MADGCFFPDTAFPGEDSGSSASSSPRCLHAGLLDVAHLPDPLIRVISSVMIFADFVRMPPVDNIPISRYGVL